MLLNNCIRMLNELANFGHWLQVNIPVAGYVQYQLDMMISDKVFIFILDSLSKLS